MTNRSIRAIQAMPAILALALMLGAAGAGGGFKGREFPEFKATDAMSGEKFSLSELRGRVVVVDFWATWCGPCVRELPDVKRLWSTYRERGLEIVSVSLDSDRSRFQSFVRSQKMTWRHVMEGGGWNTRLAKQFGVNSIPRMLVIGPDGVCIADQVRGAALERAIESGLAGVASKAKPDRAPTTAAPLPPAAGRSEAGALRQRLGELAAPLSALRQRLDHAGARLEGLERGLAARDEPERAARRAEAIYADVGDIRHELFMRGVIDEGSVVPLPGRLPAGDSDWRAIIIAIPKLREAIRGLAGALDAFRSQVAQIDHRMAQLEREPGAGPEADAAQADARRMIEQLEGAWLTRLETAHAMIDSCCLPLDQITTHLDSAEVRLGQIRAQLEKAPADTTAMRALRDDFGALCSELAVASDLSAALPGGAAPPLPSDPFEGRRPGDRRVLGQLDGQLQNAAAAMAALRQSVAAARSRFEELAATSTALRQEVAQRVEAGAGVEDLQGRFAELSRAVLALRDA